MRTERTTATSTTPTSTGHAWVLVPGLGDMASAVGSSEDLTMVWFMSLMEWLEDTCVPQPCPEEPWLQGDPQVPGSPGTRSLVGGPARAGNRLQVEHLNRGMPGRSVQAKKAS